MQDERIIKEAEQAVAQLDGYYVIAIDDTGVHLTVFPPEGDGARVVEPVIYAELKQRQIKEFDNALLIRTVREAGGAAVKIAEPPQPDAEPEVQILVARDRMEASLEIVIPKNCRPLQFEEVVNELAQSGVIFGVDDNAVKKAFEQPGRRIVCARGQQPVNGENAYIQYHVDMENKGRPVEQEDGRVDFKDLNVFTTVREGELLAEKIPATAGTAGIDVLGQTVVAKHGKDIIPPAGKNVKILEENKLVAAIAGQLLIANKKLSVVPVIEVKENVDLSTGNIEFVGSVVVRGSVQEGFTVKAEGDVEIAGTVSGGIVEGKNVVVRMGIQGMHRGYIKAVENVTAKFIENATVYAGNDVVASDVILHSKINAGQKVVVEGRRGLIAGGSIIAGDEIRAKIVGTHMATNTELGVGINPLLREEYQVIRKEIKKLEQSLEQTQKALNILKTMNPSTMPKDKREMQLKLTKAQFHLVGQVEAKHNRITDIELLLDEMRHGRIRVAENIYPGVKIMIGTLIKPIREPLKYVSFFAEEGEIKSGLYK
ncbi:MAG: FapA family protein [Veillonellales bacterium]